MRKQTIITIFLLLFSVSLFAQSADTTKAADKKPMKNRVYYGGNVGLSFGSYFRISVTPLVGYKLSPKTSVGVKVGYEYIEDKRYDPKLTSSNYGGSFFARYRIHPRVYFHGEFAYISYKYKISDIESDRQWVPFLLLGAGYYQPITPNTVFIVEVLFDVLQDDKSPYEKWNPWVSIGVGVGF